MEFGIKIAFPLTVLVVFCPASEWLRELIGSSCVAIVFSEEAAPFVELSLSWESLDRPEFGQCPGCFGGAPVECIGVDVCPSHRGDVCQCFYLEVEAHPVEVDDVRVGEARVANVVH